jgi:predicted hydrolase (HD superfamily)
MYPPVNLTPLEIPEPVEYELQENAAQRELIAGLIAEYVTPQLAQHLVCVECAMYELGLYFVKSSLQAEKWALAGLLHDIDWDACGKNDTLHCGEETQKWLQSRGVKEDHVLDACSHYGLVTVGEQKYGFENAGPGLPVDTKLRQALFAVDELCGFIVACALVRPSKSVMDMEISSVTKKFKDKHFAAQVDRNLIRSCEATLKMPLNDFIGLTLKSLQKHWGKIAPISKF